MMQKQNAPIGRPARRILIVDDHPIVRHGLTRLIQRQPDLIVCAHAADAAQALDAVASADPDLAIVDISLGTGSGIDLIKDMKKLHPRLPVLVLSMHDEALYADMAMQAGAIGYVMKQEATERLIDAIRTTIKGRPYVSPKLASKKSFFVAGRLTSPIDALSGRERQVFLLIGSGQRTRQISRSLNLSVKTIETYRSHIKDKLNFSNATELLQHAIQWVNSAARS
jgi:DNA-binding NarL/FixJ family response regulator